MKLTENTLFDKRYKLLRKLGEGGYSEVWYVEDTFAKIKLALKIFLPSAQLDERGIELFRNEFTVIYNLNHSNLLKCTYLGVADGCPYLVMPYYEGGSAEKLVGKCTEQKCWEFLHDVAAGLAHLHDQHPPIIHQDIKPDNILLDHGKFVITDFGISFNMKNALAGEVEEEVVKGTKPYMPPEKFLEDSAPLMAGDIWALGASAFELLTGRLPFRGGGLDQHEDTPVPELPGQLSQDLRALITQCLDFHPWERPFAKDIVRMAAQKTDPSGLAQGNDSLAEPAKKKPKPLSAMLIALIVATVCGIVFLVVKTLPGKENENLATSTSQTTAAKEGLDSDSTDAKSLTETSATSKKSEVTPTDMKPMPMPSKPEPAKKATPTAHPNRTEGNVPSHVQSPRQVSPSTTSSVKSEVNTDNRTEKGKGF